MKNIKRPREKPGGTFSLLMETTSKPKVTIPLVAVPIQYSIPINLFRGKADTCTKTNIKSNRTQPYLVKENQLSGGRKCLSCNNQTHNQTSSGEQTAANKKVSSMYNGSPMLILPFVSTKPSQIQQKTLPNLYNQHPVVYHAKKAEAEPSRVI